MESALDLAGGEGNDYEQVIRHQSDAFAWIPASAGMTNVA